MTELMYKGRRIWIDSYFAVPGWYAKAEVWEPGSEGVRKDEIRLQANHYFRSAQAALSFVERVTKRGIDRRLDVAHLRRRGKEKKL